MKATKIELSIEVEERARVLIKFQYPKSVAAAIDAICVLESNMTTLA
jgi:hypothetical protein